MLRPFVDSKSSGSISGGKLIMSITSEYATTGLGSPESVAYWGMGRYSWDVRIISSSVFMLCMNGDDIQCWTDPCPS